MRNIGIDIGKRKCIVCVVMAIKFRSFSKKNIPKIKHGEYS